MAQEEEDGSTREACWDFGGVYVLLNIKPNINFVQPSVEDIT
jgi:hypothetical protein